MSIMHTNAGMASRIFVKSILVMEAIMKNPTRNSAGVVAKLGIERNIGAKRIDERNSRAVEIAVRPVRPPIVTPAALSMKVVVVDVPKNAPADVAMASAESALDARGSLPSGVRNPPLTETPTRVPRVSKSHRKTWLRYFW